MSHIGQESPLRLGTAPSFVYPPPQTLLDTLRAHAARRPEAPAFVFDDLAELNYHALLAQIEAVGNTLAGAGIGSRQRVAVVAPDGPMLAMMIATVACYATVVPLNSQLTAAEVDALFIALGIDAVIVAEGVETPARTAVARVGAALFEVARQSNGLVLTLKTAPRASTAVPAEPDDAAVILRTSGTTARPKLVPVTHRNLQSMASRRQHWFGLGPADRGICVMPLYYAQGICNALLVQLILGASTAFPARRTAAEFCAWLGKFRPTWYSAGPTFHRAVLEHARAIPKGELRHALRFIQSGAAPLPPTVHDGLENIFGVPVLDTYGLSEAGNIAANSVAPQSRRRGTVGKAWPGEIALRGADGSIAERGGPGEILLRGAGVTPGYIDDPQANRAFVDGWFHTGDLGEIDSDGFLTVVGRVKELINRGGEKIAPAEIDNALQRHPDVAEAASFPVPHPRLGEDVAAAVILRADATATPLALRQFLQETLVPYKIPRRIHLVSSLPKGETGKVLRQELTRLFATAAKQSGAAWASQLEIEIAAIWHRLLGADGIGPEDDFFELGGDSLLAVEMLAALERMTSRTLPTTLLFEAATIRRLASVLSQDGPIHHQPLVQLSKGSAVPFFYFHGAFNTGGGYTRELATLLGPEQALFVVAPHGLDGDPIPQSIAAMAADRVPLIRAAQPSGPYRLGGYCLSGLVAFEAARLLMAAGEVVEFVAMVDPPTINARPSVRALLSALALVRAVAGSDVDGAIRQMWYDLTAADRASRLSPAELGRAWQAVGAMGWDWLKRRRHRATAVQEAQQSGTTRGEAYALAIARYRPAPLMVRTIYFEAEYRAEAWRRITPDLETIRLTGDHGSVVYDPSEMAQHLRRVLAEPPALARRRAASLPRQRGNRPR